MGALNFLDFECLKFLTTGIQSCF